MPNEDLEANVTHKKYSDDGPLWYCTEWESAVAGWEADDGDCPYCGGELPDAE